MAMQDVRNEEIKQLVKEKRIRAAAESDWIEFEFSSASNNCLSSSSQDHRQGLWTNRSSLSRVFSILLRYDGSVCDRKKRRSRVGLTFEKCYRLKMRTTKFSMQYETKCVW